MSTYSEKKFNAVDYNKFRPTYPSRFFKDLIRYHCSNGEFDKYLDVGCGPGEATFELASYFKDTVGTDPSQVMISTANSLINEKRTEFDIDESKTIEFKLGHAESNPSIGKSTVDLLTGAECIHWVDHDKFIKESSRVLKSNGTLAYWLYHESIFQGPQAEVANEIYNKYIYDDPRFMGPYWEQPGKTYFRQFLKICNDKLVESGYFKDIRCVVWNQKLLSDELKKEMIDKSSDVDPPRVEYTHGDYPVLLIKKDMTLKDFMNFIKTHSALHKWYYDKPETIKGTKDDLVEMMRDEFHSRCGWDDETDIQIIWDSVYVFAKRV